MIRPVDMQVLIPKTNEVARTEQVQAQKHLSEQMQFAQQMEKQIDFNSQHVIETGKSENTVISKDGGKKNTGKQDKKKRDKKKKDDENDANKSATSIFDIKV